MASLTRGRGRLVALIALVLVLGSSLLAYQAMRAPAPVPADAHVTGPR